MLHFENKPYALYLMIIFKLQHLHAECPHYYTLLEIEKDEFIPSVLPKHLSIATSEYPMFNTTEEYKVLNDIKSCVVELSCNADQSMTEFLPELKIHRLKSTDTWIELSHRKHKERLIMTSGPPDLINDNAASTTSYIEVTTNSYSTSEDTTLSSAVTSGDVITSTDFTTSTDVTASTDDTTFTDVIASTDVTISIDVTASTDDTTSSDVSKPYESSISDVPSTTDYSTTLEDTTLTDTETTTHIDKLVVGSLEGSTEAQNSYKTAAIVTGVVGGTALLAFLATKGFNALQSGTYLFPDPTMAESSV